MRLTPPTRPSFWTAVVFAALSPLSLDLSFGLAYAFLLIAVVILFCAALFTRT